MAPDIHPHLPDRWGSGQLIAFSGLDGPTDFANGLCLRTVDGPPGLEAMQPDADHGLRPRLALGGGAVRACRVASDLLLLDTERGAVRAVLLDAHHLLVEGPCTVVAGDQTVLAWSRRGDRLLLGARYAFDTARIDADLDAALAARARWHLAHPPPAGAAAEQAATWRKALAVIKGQVYAPEGWLRRRFTTPDRWPHRGMWLWDSAFHAIGLRRIDRGLARDALLAVLDTVREDGFIAIRSDPDRRCHPAYTQPPVLALATALLLDGVDDAALLDAAWPALAAYVRWDLARRDRGDGLCAWAIEEHENCRSGESGWDNSPRFDAAATLAATDFNAFLAQECELLAGFAARLGRAGDAAEFAAHHQRLCRLQRERLWDDGLGFFLDGRADGGRSPVQAASGFLPLLCGAPDAEQADRLVGALRDPRRFGTAVPVPTVAACHAPPVYAKDMWRGPMWVNVNWLIVRGLRRYGYADEAAWLRDLTLAEIERWYLRLGSLFEFYDDRGETPPPLLPRKGRNAPEVSPYHQVVHDYGWTATLYVDLLAERLGGADRREGVP